MPRLNPTRPGSALWHSEISRCATIFVNIFQILRIPPNITRYAKTVPFTAARALLDHSLAQGKTCCNAVRNNSRAVISDLKRILQWQHSAPRIFLSPSFPLPILAKSRGAPSGERDFARIGRGKEGEKGKRAPSRCATICQSRKHKVLKF